SMLWGEHIRIQASKFFEVATMTRPWAFIGALLAGSFVTGITILLLKKPVDPNAEIIQEEKEEEDISWDDLTIS
ncbi:PTS fructose transporter subunit IIC, partial [Enterococcus faecium]|nr:PTS fructose transporter subunit IIC [Enterococcus faecium]